MSRRVVCRKVSHATKVHAIMAFKRTGKNVQMNIYYCGVCKGWHLGRSSNPQRKMDRIGQLLDQYAKSHPTQHNGEQGS
jgi:hypothetical protein